jgi:hypothetical protein
LVARALIAMALIAATLV